MPNRVIWQNASPMFLDSMRTGCLDEKANGGIAYEYHSARALQRACTVGVDSNTVRKPREGMLGYWQRVRSHVPEAADLIIKDPRSLAFAGETQGVAAVALIHHLDYTLLKSSWKHRWYFARLRARLRRVDAVVAVSEFWKAELETLGCRQVEVIHNAFDLAEFDFAPEEIEAFRLEHGLTEDGPLIYIGNASKIKGVEEVYEALKDEGYTLVMTGRHRDTDIPVRWFNLPRRDYLRLLAACDVVICMSKLLEGWNRVAHEAMLCRTPVIGSGVAGMGELLHGGQQVTLKEVAGLPEAVRDVLARAETQGRDGRRFVEQFDEAYFEGAWTSLAERMMTGVRPALV